MPSRPSSRLAPAGCEPALELSLSSTAAMLTRTHRHLDDRFPPAAEVARALDARQEDLEGGAAARRAVDGDVAAALLDDAVHHRQAEAGALAALLGGEERLEDAAADCIVH